MKSTLFFFTVLILISCGKKQQEGSGNLEALIAQRDSLKNAAKELSKKISEVEAQIASLDTTAQQHKILVTAEKLEAKKFEHFFEAQATVESDKSVNINAEIPATVKQIPVSPGQQISQGQTLVILDTEVIRKNIDEVKTAYDLAKTVFQKQESLWNQKIGSEMQYLEAKNRKESLELKLKTLNSQLEKATITAPFSGIVDEIFVKQGEISSPMLPLVRLVNLQDVYLKSEVSEDYIGKVKNGTPVMAEFPSLGLSLEGKVIFTGNFINPNNRTFRINVEVNNPEGNLKPNLLANIRIKDFEKDSAIVVPSEVVMQDAQNHEYVFVLDRNGNTTAKKKIVKTGLSYNNKTLITSGLEPGEEIILEGARNVRDGEQVEQIEPKKELSSL